ISGYPEPRSVQLHFTVVPFIDPGSNVEPAEVPAPMPFVARMSSGLGAEIALAEHRAGAGFNKRSIHAPLWTSASFLCSIDCGSPQETQGKNCTHQEIPFHTILLK